MAITWKNIGPLANIPLRGARRLALSVGGVPIAVFRTSDDRVFALVDECPHRKGPLSEGMICGHAVTCPLHNWTINLADGEAAFPDEGRASVIDVRIVGGEVHVGAPSEDDKRERAA